VAVTEIWRLVPWWQGTAGEVLAAGEVLLHGAAGTAAVQWYGMAPDALILGPRQRDAAAVDEAACRARGLRVYARRSGGTAVLADRFLLNLDVALPPGHPLAPSDLTLSYAWLGEALAAGLQRLGVPAVSLPPAAVRAEAALRGGAFGLARLACFGGLSPYEVVAGGRKVVGLSQIRRRHGSLLQAGLPLRWDAEGLAGLFAGDPLWRAALAADLAGCAAGLSEWGLDLAERQAIVDVLTEELERAAGAALEARPWTEEEEGAIAHLAATSYTPVLPLVPPP
jgi:lipoate-protein ligase A